ncbi:unnamed protein product [Closterium sp. NIES-65]|nr:unnamed protein product [Closterium sp. NIES-65]
MASLLFKPTLLFKLTSTFFSLYEQIETLVSDGREVILVTSGAIGVGRHKLRFQRFMRTSFKDLQRPQGDDIDGKPCAGIGQGQLMALYESLFNQVDVGCAQLLVTERDFTDLQFRNQLRSTVSSLLDHRVVPVFNENDAISTRVAPYKDATGIFWDNDSLAALLSLELQADACVLLSDIEGLYTKPPWDPDSELIHTYVPSVHGDSIKFGQKSRLGRGGMTAKVEAAIHASGGGVPTVIASGLSSDAVLRVLSGEMVGTLFHKDAHLWAVSKSVKSAGRDMAVAARDASRKLQALSTEQRKQVLLDVADALVKREAEIVEQNAHDVRTSEINGVAPALLQRLKLKPNRIQQLAEGIRAIAEMPDPIAETLARTELAEGLNLEKQRWPLGVLLVIFEARPDAMPQIAALAIRSGNGLLLKGGKEALNSNRIIHEVIASALPPEVGPSLIGLVTSRDDISDLLKLDDVIDLVIPRGSNALVNHIKSHTKIAVLGHADGVCHVYVDKAANLKMAKRIILDAKMDYPAACNAMETLLLHEELVKSGAAAELIQELKDNGIVLHAGTTAAPAFSLPLAANLHHEYGSLECTVEIVPDIDAAIHHIHTHGSAHTDAIVTEDQEAAKKFLASVDSAVVVHNASTRFSDGFRFGLGAEVGISTSRIHARGPVGVEGLLTTRWLLRGDGHLVNKDKDIVYTHKALPIIETLSGASLSADRVPLPRVTTRGIYGKARLAVMAQAKIAAAAAAAAATEPLSAGSPPPALFDGTTRLTQSKRDVAATEPLSAGSPPPALFDGTTRLYHYKACPFAQRAVIAVNYKVHGAGVSARQGACHGKAVGENLEASETAAASGYHVTGKVPAMEHAGKVVGESLDLLLLIDEWFGDKGPRIVPEDPALAAEASALVAACGDMMMAGYSSLSHFHPSLPLCVYLLLTSLQDPTLAAEASALNTRSSRGMDTRISRGISACSSVRGLDDGWILDPALAAEASALVAACGDVMMAGYTALSQLYQTGGEAEVEAAMGGEAEVEAAMGSHLDSLEASLGKHQENGPFFLGSFSYVDIAYLPFLDLFRIAFHHFCRTAITKERYSSVASSSAQPFHPPPSLSPPFPHQVDIAYLPFLERFNITFDHFWRTDITQGKCSYVCSSSAQPLAPPFIPPPFPHQVDIAYLPFLERFRIAFDHFCCTNITQCLVCLPHQTCRLLILSVCLLSRLKSRLPPPPDLSSPHTLCGHRLSACPSWGGSASPLSTSAALTSIRHPSPPHQVGIAHLPFLEWFRVAFDHICRTDITKVVWLPCTVDIAYLPFLERFNIAFEHFCHTDITKGRPNLQRWFEAAAAIQAYTDTCMEREATITTYQQMLDNKYFEIAGVASSTTAAPAAAAET